MKKPDLLTPEGFSNIGRARMMSVDKQKAKSKFEK
jgi:hypothetical protein